MMPRPLLMLAMMMSMGAALGAQAPSPAPAPGTAAAPQGGFTYNAQGRRDPFVSLVRRGADPSRSGTGARPAGLPGLSTSEVSLKGTVASRGGYVAIVQGVDSKTYIVREGDRLLDATVRSITQDNMVLMQQVNDPLSLEKSREVRKVLRQTEEAK